MEWLLERGDREESAGYYIHEEALSETSAGSERESEQDAASL